MIFPRTVYAFFGWLLFPSLSLLASCFFSSPFTHTHTHTHIKKSEPFQSYHSPEDLPQIGTKLLWAMLCYHEEGTRVAVSLLQELSHTVFRGELTKTQLGFSLYQQYSYIHYTRIVLYTHSPQLPGKRPGEHNGQLMCSSDSN